mgnify:CR=1 FL=1
MLWSTDDYIDNNFEIDFDKFINDILEKENSHSNNINNKLEKESLLKQKYRELYKGNLNNKFLIK